MPEPEELVDLIADLVSIETENPPGNEKEAATFVRDWLRSRDVAAELIEKPDPERPQVAGRIGDGSPTVVLNGHIDVVPAGNTEKWSHDPYGAARVDGKLYGRGSADMKTGVACAMLAIAELGEEIASGELDGSLVFHAAMGEETGEPGTKTLLEEGYDGDYGVVLEPTRMRTATSEKGLAWYQITVRGDPSHASRPDQGRNAIREAQPVLDALEAYDGRIREREDELLGQAYATVTRFDAGTKENVVPEEATITVDRRILADESIGAVDEEIDELLADVAAAHGLDVEWERIRSYESAKIPEDSRLAEVFRTHAAEIADVEPEPWGVKGSTDVRNFVNDAGIEAITWGPGDLSQAHTFDEHVSIADAETGYEVLTSAVRELLSE
jgi:succinyl-diaminopimelate desuccinylase